MPRSFLQETLLALKSRGHSPADVLWVGAAPDRCVPWADFERWAKDLTYDHSYGAQHIPNDLLIVGKDWWLARVEYDGAEEWEYRTHPGRVAAKNPKPYTFSVYKH